MAEPLQSTRRALVNLPRPAKRVLLALVDVGLLLWALFLAIHFTRDPVSVGAGYPRALMALVATTAIPVFAMLGLYRAVIRFLSSRVLVSVFIGMSVLATLVLGYTFAVPGARLDLGTAVAFWTFGFLLVLGVRFVMRDFLLDRPRVRERAIIYGAGVSGARLAALLHRDGECVPIGFVDDAVTRQGTVVGGLLVHSPGEIARLIRVHGVARILLALPSASHKRRAEILASLEPHPVHVQTVPDMNDLVAGRARFDDLREVQVEDLLGRDPIPPHPELIGACVAGRSVMVTGAGGSIGSELCRQVAGLGATRLVLVEHAEAALYAIDEELRELVATRKLALEVVPVLGSVVDGELMERVMRGCKVRTVYHAAAYKHVPLVEYNMAAGIRNNVLGTLAAAQAAERAGVETFLLVSTDKAVNPTNVMGASKRFAEIILQGMRQRGSRMRICMVRFGNVLASSGSVVPRFREQIRGGGPVTVTHPEITRYFMTIEEAVQLVIQAGAMGGAAEVFLLDMGKPVKILELARKMIRLSGRRERDEQNPDGDIEIVFTGLRPGEKLYEELLISGNAVGTDHPRIWKGIEAVTEWTRVEAVLASLRVALDHNDCAVLRDILRSIVSEYRPPEDMADVVHALCGDEAAGTARSGAVASGAVVELLVARRRS